MDINKAMRLLRNKLRDTKDVAERNRISENIRFLVAYAKGEEAIKHYRDRAISAEIAKKHDKDAQLAILFNEDIYPEEYAAYQAFRVECKAKVDANMERLEKEMQNVLLQ